MPKQLFEDAFLYKEDAYRQQQNVALGNQTPYQGSPKHKVGLNDPSFEINLPGLKWPRHDSWAKDCYHFYCMLSSSYHSYYWLNKKACRLTATIHYLFDDSISIRDYGIIDTLVQKPATQLLGRQNKTGIDIVDSKGQGKKLSREKQKNEKLAKNIIGSKIKVRVQEIQYARELLYKNSPHLSISRAALMVVSATNKTTLKNAYQKAFIKAFDGSCFHTKNREVMEKHYLH